MKFSSLVPSVLAAAGIAVAMSSFSPASAFSVGGSSVTGITNSDVGSEFTVNFDGNVSTQNVNGLSSNAVFTLNSFTNGMAEFAIKLTNTSSDGIGSRVAALGFNTSPSLNSASSTGLFTRTVLEGAFPNQFGDVDVCFKSGPATCQGGANGGVSTGSMDNFVATLNFSSGVSSFDLSNFGVRYQSITGTSLGTSGTGQGTPVVPGTPNEPVPEPLTILGSATALGIGGLLKRQQSKKNNKA
jgi:hypothetical protein